MTTTHHTGPLLLQAEGIEKRYGGVRALKHVSFDLRPGEVHALVGENGAGKSTLIRILTGAVQPDAGSVSLDGRPVIRQFPASLKRTGHRRHLPAAGHFP